MTMKLIEDWKDYLWGSATSWFLMAVSTVIGTIAAHWGLLLAVLPFLRPSLQLPFAILIAVVTIWGGGMLARLSEQPKLDAKIASKKGTTDGVA